VGHSVPARTYGRVDIEAAGDDHVLRAVHDEQVALLSEVADVTGVMPNRTARLLGGLGNCGSSRASPTGATDHDFAAFALSSNRPSASHDRQSDQRRPACPRGKALLSHREVWLAR